MPYGDLRGMVVYAEPSHACTLIKPPPRNEENRTGKWVVLVSRQNCSFEYKVRMAQAVGYDAVIVHNVNSDDLEIMEAKNASFINIPAVFVSETTGVILRQVYSNPDYFIIINREEPININLNLLLPFAVVVGICFIVMIIFMVRLIISKYHLLSLMVLVKFKVEILILLKLRAYYLRCSKPEIQLFR